MSTPSRQATGRMCGEKTCPLDLEPLENDSLKDRAINNRAVATTAGTWGFNEQDHCSLHCKTIENQNNGTIINERAGTKRQIDLTASEASRLA